MNFIKAIPVWLSNKTAEMNSVLGFKYVFIMKKGQKALLRITASSLYRVFINGKLECYGPSKAPCGYARIDEWKIRFKSRALTKTMTIVVEAVGYNLNEANKSFVQAEMVLDNEIIAYSTPYESDFYFCCLNYKDQKVQRFSKSRAFIESFIFDDRINRWYSKPKFLFGEYPLCEVHDIKYLNRNIPYPELNHRIPKNIFERGTITNLQGSTNKQGVSSTEFNVFEEDLSFLVQDEIQSLNKSDVNCEIEPIKQKRSFYIEKDSYILVDMGQVLTGFVSFKLSCLDDIVVYFLFDDIMINSDIDFQRLDSLNFIKYKISKGDCYHVNMEPYSFRYLKIICLGIGCRIDELCLREYMYSNKTFPTYFSSSPELRNIYYSAESTFLQNSVDSLLSCPSYERENNLCHSFFSARAAHFFTNNTDLEYNFLENYYLISQNNDEYLPLQFPSSYTGSDLEIASKGNGIVWLIIQLDEYSKRGGDIELIESFKLIIFNKLNDLKVYTNELGLLENIPQAITFGNIDWKDCNIDFISNMLFCYALGIAGRLYNDTDLLNEAKKIYTVINSYSYNGEFYVDSANRDKDGKLCLTNVISDECQYFAYFCDIASPNSNPTLWNNIINKFDKVNSKYDFRKISNDFIGLYIRFDLLWRYNLKEKLKEEIQDYFLEMANKTGTLWEKNDIQFSCNHGYAACVAFWLGTTQYSHRLFSEHYAKR